MLLIMNRRSFLAATVASVARSEPASPFPAFSWKTIPVFDHLGKRDDDFTAREAEFLARFPLVAIEKSQAIRKGESCEEGTYRAARQINFTTRKPKSFSISMR